MTTINLVYITDQNYAMPTIVSIASAIYHKKSAKNFRIYILTNGLDEHTTRMFQELKRNDVEIIIKTLDIENFLKNNIQQTRHVTKIALLKFFLPQIIEEKRVLYLDSDLIIQNCLEEVFNTDIGTKLIAAVFDCGLFLMPKWQEQLALNPNDYFNSGVMLMDLESMRRENITEKLVTYKINNETFFMDQDALNVVFNKHVYYLEWKWNFLSFLLEGKTNETLLKQIKGLPALNQCIKSAYIVHCTDKLKPWEYKTKLSKLWIKYYKKSPYKNQKLALKKVPKQTKRPILIFIKYALLQNI